MAKDIAKYPGGDLVAIRLLADLVNETEAGLAHRVGRARASGASWQAFAEALASTVTEVRLRYDDPPGGPGRFLRNEREARPVKSQPLWG